MPAVQAEEMAQLLAPYLNKAERAGREEIGAHPGLLKQLSVYLDLLLKWNERTNLTAIRDPRQIVRRHFGESLFLARHLSASGSLLDLGSGAGFPGLPIQLWHPNLKVTLAESHGKKASFLREIVRLLSLGTEVWGGRAEDLAPRRFDSVALRAVDDPRRALAAAAALAKRDVWLLGSSSSPGQLSPGVEVIWREPVPEAQGSFLFLIRKILFHVEPS